MTYDRWKTRSPDDGQYDPALDEKDRPPSSETAHYLGSIRVHLELLYELVGDPRVREHISDEVDWIDASLIDLVRHG